MITVKVELQIDSNSPLLAADVRDALVNLGESISYLIIPQTIVTSDVKIEKEG